MRAQKAGGQKGDKAIVLGIVERTSGSKPKRVRATVISDRKKESIAPEVAGAVERGTKVYSDEFGGTWEMLDRFEHAMVHHLTTYVEGQVHTNSVENFWWLLKRGLHSKYIAVEPIRLVLIC
jgi:hypothetical protein